MEPVQQPGQEKCWAVNKHYIEIEITGCSGSIPYLPDTKQPVPLHLNCRRWHFVVGTCHLEEVSHLVDQGGFIRGSFQGTGSLVLRITVRAMYGTETSISLSLHYQLHNSTKFFLM